MHMPCFRMLEEPTARNLWLGFLDLFAFIFMARANASCSVLFAFSSGGEDSLPSELQQRPDTLQSFTAPYQESDLSLQKVARVGKSEEMCTLLRVEWFG